MINASTTHALQGRRTRSVQTPTVSARSSSFSPPARSASLSTRYVVTASCACSQRTSATSAGATLYERTSIPAPCLWTSCSACSPHGCCRCAFSARVPVFRAAHAACHARCASATGLAVLMSERTHFFIFSLVAFALDHTRGTQLNIPAWPNHT